MEENNLKEFLKIMSTFAVLFAILLYSNTAFLLWQLDPGQWSIYARAIVCLFFIVGIIFLYTWLGRDNEE